MPLFVGKQAGRERSRQTPTLIEIGLQVWMQVLQVGSMVSKQAPQIITGPSIKCYSSALYFLFYSLKNRWKTENERATKERLGYQVDDMVTWNCFLCVILCVCTFEGNITGVCFLFLTLQFWPNGSSFNCNPLLSHNSIFAGPTTWKHCFNLTEFKANDSTAYLSDSVWVCCPEAS